jgi:hypothetical protein
LNFWFNLRNIKGSFPVIIRAFFDQITMLADFSEWRNFYSRSRSKNHGVTLKSELFFLLSLGIFIILIFRFIIFKVNLMFKLLLLNVFGWFLNKFIGIRVYQLILFVRVWLTYSIARLLFSLKLSMNQFF